MKTKPRFAQLPASKWPKGLHFPGAVIGVDPSELEKRGAQFFEDSDDLDRYKAALLRFEDGTQCALVRYARAPKPGTSIWVEKSSPDIQVVVENVLDVFDLPRHCITWEGEALKEEAGLFVIPSKVRALLRSQKMDASGTAVAALSKAVENLVKKACKRAHQQSRKCIEGEDFLHPTKDE